MAKQSLLSCWTGSERVWKRGQAEFTELLGALHTRISRRPDGPFDSILHMLFWNVERPPHSSGTPRRLCGILPPGRISAPPWTLADQHSPRAISGSRAVPPAFGPEQHRRLTYCLSWSLFTSKPFTHRKTIHCRLSPLLRGGQAKFVVGFCLRG